MLATTTVEEEKEKKMMKGEDMEKQLHISRGNSQQKQKPPPQARSPSRRRAETRTPPMDMELDEARRGFGKMGFGCKHYRRRCRIRAPCCNDVFNCRHCHNESTVICLVCDTEQPVSLCSALS
ncbi:hypothetical protein QYE76_067913 [Lolium multiflorum]|uniref:CHY-type domain-containing protein n=1 Tax=Lolium multiflorum TaxID=4521 RepID=A0AAD8SEF0_LOLMU|nr:hypothetical protein QYE76_067913 [Lolium multiflorum]